ncbi:curli assembly protein CsgF [Sphingobium bisphenolivorans]|uniref:curli assembly protein CsgF n=1 Tax=Sphingobium bisphenolivorans TaxID=1335760 RepID=UPI001EE6DC9C|nr:curli assembly protein CsgF [Sphingobium bisphenolivorans]
MKHLRLAMLGAIALAAPASAQELKFEFRNPSFGGNPFNSDHLLATATAQRPPQKSSGADGTGELTEAQLFARQIQSRLLSALSSSVVEAITGSNPGTSGEFTVGDQKISFERTLSEIRLSIFDNSTGETTDIVVPVLTLNTANAQSAANTGSVESSLAQSLAATNTLTGQ